MTMTVTTYNTTGVSSVARQERFEQWSPKQEANRAVRRNFPDLPYGGKALGLLGISDINFYHAQGFDPEHIITVEHRVWPNHASLQNDVRKAGFDSVEVVLGDVFEYIASLPNGSISALFLDLYGFSELCPNSANKDRDAKLALLCPKLADKFHFHFTFEDQRSRSIWEQKAKEAFIDSNRSKHVLSRCSKLLAHRGIRVGQGLTCKYKGLLSDNRTCQMVTTSFIGSKED